MLRGVRDETKGKKWTRSYGLPAFILITWLWQWAQRQALPAFAKLSLRLDHRCHLALSVSRSVLMPTTYWKASALQRPSTRARQWRRWVSRSVTEAVQALLPPSFCPALKCIWLLWTMARSRSNLLRQRYRLRLLVCGKETHLLR